MWCSCVKISCSDQVGERQILHARSLPVTVSLSSSLGTLSCDPSASLYHSPSMSLITAMQSYSASCIAAHIISCLRCQTHSAPCAPILPLSSLSLPCPVFIIYPFSLPAQSALNAAHSFEALKEELSSRARTIGAIVTALQREDAPQRSRRDERHSIWELLSYKTQLQVEATLATLSVSGG